MHFLCRSGKAWVTNDTLKHVICGSRIMYSVVLSKLERSWVDVGTKQCDSFKNPDERSGAISPHGGCQCFFYCRFLGVIVSEWLLHIGRNTKNVQVLTFSLSYHQRRSRLTTGTFFFLAQMLLQIGHRGRGSVLTQTCQRWRKVGALQPWVSCEKQLSVVPKTAVVSSAKHAPRVCSQWCSASPTVKPRMCTQDWPAISVVCGVLQCSECEPADAAMSGTSAQRWRRFHRIFSSTSVHREQECGRFCASVEDVATKTPCENARNRVGSDRSFEGAANHIAALRPLHQDLHILRNEPIVDLFSALSWFEPEAADHLQTLVHVSLVSSLPPPLRRGTQPCPQTDVAIVAWWTGLYGTVLGTGSGSQSVEAFHSTWERCATAITSAKEPYQGLAVMQALCRDGMAAVVFPVVKFHCQSPP